MQALSSWKDSLMVLTAFSSNVNWMKVGQHSIYTSISISYWFSVCMQSYSDVTGCDSNVDTTIVNPYQSEHIEILHECFCGSLPPPWCQSFWCMKPKMLWPMEWYRIETKKVNFSQSLSLKSCYGNWNEWKLEDGWINGVNKTGHKSRQGQEKEGRQAK